MTDAPEAAPHTIYEWSATDLTLALVGMVGQPATLAWMAWPDPFTDPFISWPLVIALSVAATAGALLSVIWGRGPVTAVIFGALSPLSLLLFLHGPVLPLAAGACMLAVKRRCWEANRGGCIVALGLAAAGLGLWGWALVYIGF